MRRALLLSLLVFSAGAHAQGESGPSIVLTAHRALIILEPRLVISQNVLSFSTSPSGRYLVAVQEVPGERPLEIGKALPEPKAKKIVIWDSTTGVSREIALPMGITATDITIEWFPTTEKALVSVPTDGVEILVPEGVASRPGQLYHGRVTEWHILDAPSATMRKAFADEGTPWNVARLSVSPVEPFAIKSQTKQPTSVREDGRSYPHVISLQRLDVDGRMGTEVKVPDMYSNLRATGWGPDGRRFQMEMSRPPSGPGEYVPCVVLFDPTTGNFTDVIGPVPSFEAKAKVSDVALAYDVTQLDSAPVRRTVATWWLKSTTETKEPKAVIAEHASLAELPSGERFVVILVNGTLFTRQVIQLTLEEYEQMRAAAARSVLISNAKQVALGVLIYATDYDGMIPANMNLQKELGPYLRNDSLLEGFVMVFPGGNLFGVKDPANTILGYIEGPGGRAIAYVDGHVKWEKTGG